VLTNLDWDPNSRLFHSYFFLPFPKPNGELPNLPKKPMCKLILSTTMVNAKEVQYNPNVVRLVGHINDEPTIDRFKKATHEIL